MEEAIKLFKTGMYVRDIAKIVGINKWRLSVELRKLGFSPKSNASTKSNHPNWKGGRTTNADGYAIVRNAHHHRSNYGYVLEHVIIAEEKVGRRLLYFGKGDQRNETVHHINGIKTDNRPENLDVLGTSQHSKLEWAENSEKYPQSKINQMKNPEKYNDWLRKNAARLNRDTI